MSDKPKSADNLKSSLQWSENTETPFLKIKGLNKQFGEVIALDDISLSIYRKEFFALLGPSGCGKSTLLRILAGFEEPTNGTIQLEGKDILNVPTHRRPVNMMFQSYALFPHMSVEQNIAFGLKQDKLTKQEIKRRTDEAIEMVQLTSLAKRKPNQLSGGQKQRTALARSLVKRPKLLLLDEPLGALDKKLREETQFELVDLQEQLEMTFIIVTHDQEEAMTMATRIAVMNKGEIAQLGTPREIYEYPRTRFSANFIGNINILEGNVVSKDATHFQIHCQDENSNFSAENVEGEYLQIKAGDQVGYAIRPEKIHLEKLTNNSSKPNQHNHIEGEVVDIGYLGSHSVYHVKLDSGKSITVSNSNRVRQEFTDITWEDRVLLSWENSSALILKT